MYVTGVLINREVLALIYRFMLHLSVQSCGKDGHAAGSCSDDVCGLERTLQYPTHEDQHGAEHFPHLSDIMFKEIKSLFYIYTCNVISLLQGYASPSALPKSRVQTDVALPPLKKLAPAESVAKERLFVIFNPSPPPVDVLEDVFW